MNDELRKVLERQKGTKMSPEEFEAQRLSFIYGNAPHEDKGSKEDVRRTLTEPDYEPLEA